MIAKNIMSSSVVTLSIEDTVDHARKMMKEYAISQLPVLEGGKVVGIITEGDIVNAYEKHGSDTLYLKIKEIMQKAPPEVEENTDIHTIIELLKKYPAVIVTRNNTMIGIITKADIVYWAMLL